jgi:sterol desaturase/sphingolipid hydroxylase (fatty acid hydroxylase superfamily)
MCSAPNYWFMLVADIVGAAGFLLVGARLFHGTLVVAASAMTSGFLAWGGIEYAVHRWVLHGPPSPMQRAHAQHHRHATALISAPALVSCAAACGIFLVLCAAVSAGVAALVVGGLYVGYNHYALLHHMQHHHPRLVAMRHRTRQLQLAHRIHHARYVVNYGVTTACWDRLFGSYQAAARAAHPVRQSSGVGRRSDGPPC